MHEDIGYDPNVAELISQIKVMMPLLKENYQSASFAFENGSIGEGHYEHICKRYNTTKIITRIDIFPLTKTETRESIFEQNAMLFRDIDHCIKGKIGEEKTEAEAQREELLDIFVRNGFTEMHPFFEGVPFKPAEEKKLSVANKVRKARGPKKVAPSPYPQVA